MKRRKSVYKPGFVCRPGGRRDDHFSRKSIARFLQQSTRESMAGRTDPLGGAGGDAAGPSGPCSLFDLAPSGVYRARPVTRPAGELLPHRFTLTARAEAREAVCFLLHFPWPRGRWALPITASYGARTFLSPSPTRNRLWQFPSDPAGDHPTDFRQMKHRLRAVGWKGGMSNIEGDSLHYTNPKRKRGLGKKTSSLALRVSISACLTPKSRTTRLIEEPGCCAQGNRDGTSSTRPTCVRNSHVW